MVVFDIPSDRIRRKAGEMCKDYGLMRLQWSAFEGLLTRNRREELWMRLVELVDGEGDGGRLAIFPIGAREAAWAERWSSELERDRKEAKPARKGKGRDSASS